jgi:hypothetical protein
MPKPKGRTLDEFLDNWGQLLPAEQTLLEASAQGEIAEIATARPGTRTEDNEIRPGFLRFLALGGDEQACVHEIGLQLRGAWIRGDLDFEACDIPLPISLEQCHLAGKLNLLDATLPGLFLERTSLRSLDAERLDCHGSVRINNSVVEGPVSFTGARIGGDIDCIGSHFMSEDDGEEDDDGKDDDCFKCNGAEIKGNVILGYPFRDTSFFAHGGVDFSGAQIDGDVRCNAVQFEDEVWLIGTRIKGDLDFSRCSLTQGLEPAELVLTRADVGGRLFFRKVTGALHRITLRGATVAALVDDMPSWRVARELLLDGFRYSRFIDTDIQDGTEEWAPHASPTDAKPRIDWLERQRKDDLHKYFKPQPWEQLIKVLRDTGLQDGARTVAIAKQKWIRKSRPWAQVLHRIYGVLCGYGYRPVWLIGWAVGVAVIWAVFFLAAERLGVMAPTDWRVVAEATDLGCRPELGGNWTTCQGLHRRGYPSFDPVVYSFDLILPVIATQQTKDWAPATTLRCTHRNELGFCEQPIAAGVISSTSGYWLPGVIFWLLARIETIAGWAFGLMFVAIVSGLIKKD